MTANMRRVKYRGMDCDVMIATAAIALYADGTIGMHIVAKKVATKSAKKKKKPEAKQKMQPLVPRLVRGGNGRWIKRLGLVFALLLITPLFLTLLYRVPVMHPVSTLMAKDLVLLRGYDRQWVDINEIAPVLVHSVMMSEDGQFCSHNGIDWEALNQVIDNALEGEKTRGASTIPMQTAKNLFLWSSRSYIRKALEIPLAWYMDVVLPKKRIMEIYLNIAEWGDGVYGAEAAARHHFGVSAAKLSRKQAALLAVTLPAPKLRNPAKPSRGMRRLADIVAKRAHQAGGYVDCVE